MFESGLFQNSFMPHGYCIQWRPDILWLHVISDLLIATAYFSIPIALFIFVKKRKDIQFRGVFLLFGLFIFFCGITHLMSIYNMWHGAYALHGVLKAMTAAISLATAYVTFKNMEVALQIPSRANLQKALEEAANEKVKAKKLEIEKRGQEIFKFTTELMPSGLLVVDEQQIIVMANAALCRIFGYHQDELPGKHLSCLIDHKQTNHSALVKKYMAAPDQHHRMAAGRVVSGVHKLGHLVDLQISLSVHDYAGEKHTFATVTDFDTFLSNIHQTKILEDKLAENTKFLNEVLQRSLTGLYIFDFQTQRYVYINPEFTKLTGYELGELTKIYFEQGYLALYHPEDVNLMRAHFNDLSREEGDLREGVEYRFKHRNGNWLWLYSRDSVYSYDADGQPKELLGAFFDITELKQREQQIRKLAIEYSATFEQAGIGIAHINEDYSFIKANPKFLDIFSYDEINIQSLNFLDLCEASEKTVLRTIFGTLLDTNKPIIQVEKQFIRCGGTKFWADVILSHVSAVNDEDSAYFIVVLEDISQRKLMEKNLSESNQALERFAYSASHDLQEPLRKISAFSGALEQRIKSQINDPDVYYQLERIVNASVRMSKMIDNLLKLSRSTKESLTIKTVSLSSLLVQSLDDLSSKICSKLQACILTKDIMLNVDPGAFGQVLSNLISNSVAYQENTRPLVIRVMAERAHKKTVIRYQDNGQGIPADKLELIFEPFRRLHLNDKPGTGMGLTICRQVMKAHGGQIYASQRPNMPFLHGLLMDAGQEQNFGAEFIIEFPTTNIFSEKSES